VAEHADIRVRLTPRAAREQIAAGPDGSYAVRVNAPPVDGRANDALCRLIAARAGVAPSRVSVVRGVKAREKVVRVEGVDSVALRGRLLA
jgi:uncharacterized protein YggU (UPF0235/DUF167 family)